MWVAVQSHSDKTRHQERRDTEGPQNRTNSAGSLRYDTERVPLHAQPFSLDLSGKARVGPSTGRDRPSTPPLLPFDRPSTTLRPAR